MKSILKTLSANFFIVVLSLNSCQGQTSKIVGDGCEGCEAIYEYGNTILTPTDTLPKFKLTEPKLKLTGTVYKKDGKSPAENVILYIYHTNRQGIYETKGDETGLAKRHGYIRGWIKAGKDGKYTFYTFRPAAYPSGLETEHIHITVKEPNTNEYYIDSFVFNDDPKLTQKVRNSLENRGGSGIVQPTIKNGILTVHRDIVLGLNIPNYD